MQLTRVFILILFPSTKHSALVQRVSAFKELRGCDPSLLLSEIRVPEVGVLLSVTSLALLARVKYTLNENFLLQNSCCPALAPWVSHRQRGEKRRIQSPLLRPQGMRLQYLILATNSFVA